MTLNFVGGGASVLSVRATRVDLATCGSRRWSSATRRSGRVIICEAGGKAGGVTEEKTASPEMPSPHRNAMVRDFLVSAGTYGTLKVISGPIPNPVVGAVGFITAWLGITALPFLLKPDRTVDIKTLESRSGMNTDLVAPTGYTTCSPPPRKEAKVFDMSRTELRDKFFSMVKKQQNVTFLGSKEEDYLYGLVQLTPLARFPDVISVQFLNGPEDSETSSTLAIFSTSIFGEGDLGRNKSRVDQWLQALEEE